METRALAHKLLADMAGREKIFRYVARGAVDSRRGLALITPRQRQAWSLRSASLKVEAAVHHPGLRRIGC